LPLSEIPKTAVINFRTLLLIYIWHSKEGLAIQLNFSLFCLREIDLTYRVGVAHPGHLQQT